MFAKREDPPVEPAAVQEELNPLSVEDQPCFREEQTLTVSDRQSEIENREAKSQQWP